MTLDETIQNLNELSELISENTPRIAGIVASNAKAMIQRRIQETGLDSNEQSYPAYSPEYKKKRLKKGLNSPFTNMTFTGEMWRGTRVIREGYEGANYSVVIGGGNTDAANKLSYMEAQYSDVLKLSKAEINISLDSIDDELEKLIKQAGL